MRSVKSRIGVVASGSANFRSVRFARFGILTLLLVTKLRLVTPVRAKLCFAGRTCHRNGVSPGKCVPKVDFGHEEIKRFGLAGRRVAARVCGPPPNYDYAQSSTRSAAPCRRDACTPS